MLIIIFEKKSITIPFHFLICLKLGESEKNEREIKRKQKQRRDKRERERKWTKKIAGCTEPIWTPVSYLRILSCPFLPISPLYPYIFSLYTHLKVKREKKTEFKGVHAHRTSYYQPVNYMVIFPALTTMIGSVNYQFRQENKIKIILAPTNHFLKIYETVE